MSASRWNLVLFGLACTVLALLLAWPLMDVSLGGDQYVYLARHFARGNLNVDDLSSVYGDYVRWHGHKYLPFGPLPAVLLMPFLPLINAGMAMVVVGYVFTAINIFLFLRLLDLAGVTGERRLWATLLYFGGTTYLSVTLGGISTYFAHVVVTTFLLLAMREMLLGRRLSLAGLFLGLAGAARFTAVFSLPFFLRIAGSVHPAARLKDEGSKTRSEPVPNTVWIGRAVIIATGLALPLLVLSLYNYARFGSITETGFGMAVLYTPVLGKARAAGLFSLGHIPKNLFMMLLQGPQPVGGDSAPVLRFPYVQPSPWGMGLFFASPALLFVFRNRLSDPLVQACWLGVVSVMLPIITFYGIGFVQFSYRYALDFMPFLALLAARGFPDPMTSRARALVAASVLINIWGAIFVSLWI